MKAERRVWQRIRYKCNNPKNDHFADYGGRGIVVCAEWDTFEVFFVDMGFRPTPLHSIGRKDNDGPYAKWNCEWQLMKQQARNRRTSRIIKALGKRMTAADWQDETGIPSIVIRKRIDRGWTPEDAVSTPNGQSVPRGSECMHAKLTEHSVFEIRKRIKNGELCVDIAMEIGVSCKTIERANSGATWAHVK